jgi:drug/metabolite transporter (DMT)-like permease
MSAALDLDGDLRAYRHGLLLVLLAGVCWSIMGIGVRLMEGATAWQILLYRSLALAVFLFLVVAYRTRGRPFGAYRRAGRQGVLGGLALVLAFSGSIVSVKNTTVANAMFLFATAPFIAAVLGRLLIGEAVRRATWIAMAVAALGVAIMVWEGIALGHLLGNLAALVSALGFALFTLALRWNKTEDMLPAVSLGGLFTLLVALGVCLVGQVPLVVSLRDTGLALALGVFQLGLGLAIYTLGAKVVPAAELALLAMTEVVLGPFWVWLFLGEGAGPMTLLGGLILLGAIAGNAVTRLRHRPPPIMA